MENCLTTKAKVSSKGWVVIPKDIREALGIKPGDEVRLTLWPSRGRDANSPGRLRVRKVPADPIAASAGMIRQLPGEPLWTEQMVEEHREEVEKEEQEFRERTARQDARVRPRKRSA